MLYRSGVVMAKAKRKQWKISVLLALKSEIEKSRRQRRPRSRPRDRRHAIEEMNHLSETEFMAMFRMDRASFNEVEVELENSLPSVNRNISIKTRLSVTLRWLAGGQYLDLCFTWGISKASFFSVDGVLWPTIIALDAILPSFGLPVHNADAMRDLPSC